MNEELLVGLRALAERMEYTSRWIGESTSGAAHLDSIPTGLPDPRMAALRGEHETCGESTSRMCKFCDTWEWRWKDTYCLRTDADALDQVVFAHGWDMDKYHDGLVIIWVKHGKTEQVARCHTYPTSVENEAAALLEACNE